MPAKRTVSRAEPPTIIVLAGVNGAGKSSIAGASIRAEGANYFNPDEAARLALQRNPELNQSQANSLAWNTGKRLLENAICAGRDFYFETTLGGNSITALLIEAAGQGFAVNVWYAGLASVELHLQRVARRVRKGGHDIPVDDIRRRWAGSHLNLIRLLPYLTKLRVYDNSHEADPATGAEPAPVLVLDYEKGSIVGPPDLGETPGWAKPIVAAAIKISRDRATPGADA